MKILVNATTLVVGGGVQVGVSFIEYAVEVKDITFKFIVSKSIYNALSAEIINSNDIICIDPSPARPIKGYQNRKLIKKICHDWNPDLVYSIGFPSYINFKKTEVGRFTNPWQINDKPLPWHLYPNLLKRFKIWALMVLRQHWSKKANYFETQTEGAKNGIIKRLGIKPDKILVIPNSINKVFIQNINYNNIKFNSNQIPRVFCLAAPYPHKNLGIIPEIISKLNKKHNLETNFILTLPYDSLIWLDIEKSAKKLNVSNQIINVGKLKLDECLSEYKKADVVFMPTLLEIFSATYLEAMAMGVPIVTADMNFAHDNCGDAAMFYDANNLDDAANKLAEVITNNNLRKNLITAGYNKFNTYPVSGDKYNLLFNWFKATIHH